MVWISTGLLLLCVTTAFARGPPQIVEQGSRRVTEEAGDTVRLVCHVDADPPALVQWMKWNEQLQDDEIINSAWDRYRTLTNALKIKDMHVLDSGRYTCKATNGFGSIDVDYWLHVKANSSDDSTPPWESAGSGIYDPNGGAPHFQRKEQMVALVQRPVGSVVRMKCRASGRPKPDIIWFKDGSIFTEGTAGLSADHKWSITLENLGTHDSGKYMCKVFNRHGAINFTYTLEVKDRLKPELLTPHPQNQTVPPGGTATFQCKVKSSAQPHIQWLKRVDNGVDARNKNQTITIKGQEFIVLQTSQTESARITPVNTNKNKTEVWPSSDGTHYLNKLTLHRVTEYDSGMYICLGINSVGHSFKPAYLSVLPNPDGVRRSHHDEYPSHLESPSLPLIIAVPAVVIVIIVAIAIYMLQRRKRDHGSPRPVTTVVARQHRMAPPPMSAQDKMFAEQYTALQPLNGVPPQNGHLNGVGHMMPNTPSRYNITPYDLHSDISIAKMTAQQQTPVHPVMQPLTQNHLHNHNLQNQGHFYNTYDNC